MLQNKKIHWDLYIVYFKPGCDSLYVENWASPQVGHKDLELIQSLEIDIKFSNLHEHGIT